MVITVKIKPWLKEFLVCKFGEPVIAERNSLTGALIGPLLEYTPDNYIPVKYLREESIEIDVPRDLTKNATRTDFGNVYVSDYNQQIFERGVSELFKEILFNYMNDKIRYENRFRSSNFKDCIYQFCIDYNISFNSIQYENLKKMYYRHRKKREKLKITGRNLSLMCPLILL